MHPDMHMLAELLSLAALMAATIDYAEVTKRRAPRRAGVAPLENEGVRGWCACSWLMHRAHVKRTKPLPPSYVASVELRRDSAIHRLTMATGSENAFEPSTRVIVAAVSGTKCGRWRPRKPMASAPGGTCATPWTT
jgi:hypothetical protein